MHDDAHANRRLVKEAWAAIASRDDPNAIERYFAEGPGIDDDKQAALRAAFLEPDIPAAR